MTEKEIQYNIVKWFSQTYPQFYGLLFELNNDVYDIKHYSKRISMGMVTGISDLALLIPLMGEFAGIELKAPGKSHKKDHIQMQIDWGKKIIENGFYYIMSYEIEVIKDFIINLLPFGNIEKALEIQKNCMLDIEEKLKTNKKSIKF